MSERSVEQIAAEQALGVSVYMRVRPPHKHYFEWILYERADNRILASGIERTLERAVVAGSTRRLEVWTLKADQKFQA